MDKGRRSLRFNFVLTDASLAQRLNISSETQFSHTVKKEDEPQYSTPTTDVFPEPREENPLPDKGLLQIQTGFVTLCFPVFKS